MTNFTWLKQIVLTAVVLLITTLAYSQQELYFSEILLDKSGDEETYQFIEIRGEPNLTIDARTYIGVIEGDIDGTSQEGVMKWWFDISGLSIGSNGYLVIRHKGSPFTVAAGATVVTGASATTTTDTDADGFNDLDAGSYVGSSSKGTIEQYSQSFLLINATADVSRTDEYETEGDGLVDGQPDGADYSTWTILDQISTIDDDGEEIGYGPLVFQFDDDGDEIKSGDFLDDGLYNDSNVIYEAGAVVVKNTFEVQYLARVGATTGSATTDWFGAKLNDNSGVISFGNETIAAYEDMLVSTIGGPNFVVTYESSAYTPTAISPVLDLIVAETLTSAGDMEVYSLTVNSGQVFTVATGHTLTVNGSLTVDGSLVIESGASLITYDGNTVGDVTINRNTTFSDGKYSFVGTPVASDAGITGSDLGSHVYSYDELQAYSAAGGNRWVNASSTQLVPGVGYTQANQEVISFTGVPNDGDVTVAGLTYTTGTAAEQGWALLSNPYPAAINVVSFLAGNGDLDNAIYLWDDGGSDTGAATDADYITANSIGTVAGSNTGSSFEGYIGSMQGFFVKVAAEGMADVTFTESMRVSDNNTDGSFFRQTKSNGSLNVKLSVSSENGLYNEMLVGLRNDATLGKDRLYDAGKLSGNNNLQFYSLIEDSKYAIQGLPLESGVSTELAFDLGEAAQLKLSVVEMTGLEEGMTFYITDKETGIVYDLNTIGTIDFNGLAGTDQNRFSLRYGSVNSVLDIASSSIQPIYRYLDNELTVKFADSIQIDEVVVYDISGQILLKDSSKSIGNELKISIANKGINIVKLRTSQGDIIEKFLF